MSTDQQISDEGVPQLARSHSGDSGQDVMGLEQELKQTRHRLQSVIEEYATALEELKSGNKELVSVNEELQSVNEKLHAVNHELAGKVDEFRRSNADLHNLFESTRDATLFLDRFMMIRSYTPSMTAIFSVIPADRGRPIADISHQLEDVDLKADLQAVLTGCKVIERPVRVRDGKIFYLMRVLPYRTANDEIDGVLLTFVDVTAVVIAEEQQRLLVSELNHRVRNMMQVVMGLASQTLHRAQSLDGFGKAFLGRLQALARAYELLSRDGWHNALVVDLVNSQLEPFAAEGRRYKTGGPPVMLTANAALALGLVFYELATNAVKYGALSRNNGCVDVNWRLEQDVQAEQQFVMTWEETGGPPVQPPTRVGFGSELIQRQLRYEVSGEAKFDFREAGLIATLSFPASDAVIGVEPNA